MSKNDQLMDALDQRVERRNERRNLFKLGGGFAVGAIGGAVLGACSSSSDTAVAQNPPAGAVNLDVEILNFALQLEYLEAQFYSYAAFGTGLPQSSLTGTGTQGAVTGGRQVNFTDPLVRRYANEIAAGRSRARRPSCAPRSAAPPWPSRRSTSAPLRPAPSPAPRAPPAWSARGTRSTPMPNDDNFLLGAFIFEDVGVTAYKGAAPLLTYKTFLEAAAGLLAAEAYHAGLVRTVLYAKGLGPDAATHRSDLQRPRQPGRRDATSTRASAATGTGNAAASNIVPTDANGLAYSRTRRPGAEHRLPERHGGPRPRRLLPRRPQRAGGLPHHLTAVRPREPACGNAGGLSLVRGMVGWGMTESQPNGAGRCAWCGTDPLYVAYHDTEWGVPEYDARALWEKLVLDGFQAGLAWITILRKRDACAPPSPASIPRSWRRYGEADRARLMADAGIIRSRAKIDAAIRGAQIYRRDARQRRGLRRLAVVLRRTARRSRASASAATSRPRPRPRRHGQGAEEAGLQLLRPGDRLCLHAGDGHGQRPRRRVLPLRGSPGYGRVVTGKTTAKKAAPKVAKALPDPGARDPAGPARRRAGVRRGRGRARALGRAGLGGGGDPVGRRRPRRASTTPRP